MCLHTGILRESDDSDQVVRMVAVLRRSQMDFTSLELHLKGADCVVRSEKVSKTKEIVCCKLMAKSMLFIMVHD